MTGSGLPAFNVGGTGNTVAAETGVGSAYSSSVGTWRISGKSSGQIGGLGQHLSRPLRQICELRHLQIVN